MKKVRFNNHITVHIVPREDRTGHWIMDVCRFKARILKVERAIGWCLIQKQQKIYSYNINDGSDRVAKENSRNRKNN